MKAVGSGRVAVSQYFAVDHYAVGQQFFNGKYSEFFCNQFFTAAPYKEFVVRLMICPRMPSHFHSACQSLYRRAMQVLHQAHKQGRTGMVWRRLLLMRVHLKVLPKAVVEGSHLPLILYCDHGGIWFYSFGQCIYHHFLRNANTKTTCRATY